ncbi:MAG: MFS transporter [Calditrichaeota bacterium]|nr:MAG: MFS transporter [Calditrichota bacterium]
MISKQIFTKQLILNWITRILFFTSLSGLLPALPQYVIDIGGSYAQTGIVMSAFAVGVLVFRPLVGRQIDRVGRKAILLFGILVFVISPVVYIFVHSIHSLLPVRVFHGLGLAAFGTASITLITDAAPEANRGEVISYTGMVNTVAFAFGPVVGFSVWEKWGYTTLFSFVAGLSLLCLFFSIFLRETKTERDHAVPRPYFATIKQRKVLVAALMILLVALVHGGVMFYMPIFLKGLHTNIGFFFTVYGISAFIIRLFVGPVSDRIGRGPLVVFSLSILAVGVFTLSHTAGVGLMFLSAVLYGVGFGAHQPTLTALVADNTTEETRGQVFSFYYGGFDLGVSVAGVVLGLVAEKFGIKSMFMVCSGLAIAALLLFVTIIESRVATSLRFAFSVQKEGEKCVICDQFQEVAPEQAEEYFKSH